MTSDEACAQLNSLVRFELQQKGLVKTGRLLKSIQWIYNNGRFQMISEDYFQYLDEKHSITKDLVNSQGFKDVMTKFLATQIETSLSGPNN